MLEAWKAEESYCYMKTEGFEVNLNRVAVAYDGSNCRKPPKLNLLCKYSCMEQHDDMVVSEVCQISEDDSRSDADQGSCSSLV